MSENRHPGAALVGAVLANSYEVRRLIGQGGMGAVYEGRHMRLGQRVAIKVMAADLATSREALSRFRREAQVTSAIRHPHIVHVFDFGSALSGEPFLVMEYLDGEDLDHRIARLGRIAVHDAVHVVKQTAAALAAAHAKGIVHRDLKPANIFLLDLEGEADFVKVVDFGISKVKATSTKLTRSSVVMGTPDYMSPEQARGKIDDIDHRTDQWALAAITYEMLCGRTPFAGEDVASVLYQVTREEPEPLTSRVRGVPVEIDRVIQRALSKRAADRFASITAFSRALEESTTGLQGKAEQPEPTPRLPSASRKATVSYGARQRREDDPPDTLEVTSPDFAEPTIVDRPPGLAPANEQKRTTFSHATGETRLAASWARFRTQPKWMVGGASVIVLLVIAGLSAIQSRSRPALAPAPEVASKASGTSVRPPLRPVIQPMDRPVPPFVGPPTPPPGELAPPPKKTPISASRAPAGENAEGGEKLLDPFEQDPEPPRPRPAETIGDTLHSPGPPMESETKAPPRPIEPTPKPVPQPAHPQPRIIREL